MSDDLLTTRDAAALLGVSPSTVKRWEEQGLLPCEHTVGGHRRFRATAVRELLAAANRSARSPAEPPSPVTGSGDSWRTRTLDLALSSDDLRPLVAELEAQRDLLGAWWPVADRLGEVLVALGRAWASGALTIVDEHLASERLRRAALTCADAFPPGPGAPRALLATANGEDHDLGLVLVELVLREAGWTVRWAGRRSPAALVADYLGRGGVDLVVLTASVYATDTVGLAEEAATLARVAGDVGALLLLGGSGPWPDPPPPGAVRLFTFAELRRWLDAGPTPASR